MTASSLTGLIVDALGFLTGAVLYVMLVAMVAGERRREGGPLLSGRGRLPLLTGLFGLVWNVGALLSFGTRVVVGGEPQPILVALAFGALGCLPAVVVQSLVEGPGPGGRAGVRLVVPVAYALSVAAAVAQLAAALSGASVPSRQALWSLTAGFTALTGWLLVAMRRQPIGRRGLWVAALAIFAVSAWHFGRHGGNETWWVELIGHHASLLLALTILYQDYRFALADLFLKNAIALLLLMAVSLTLFSVAVAPLLFWYDATGRQDPRAIALLVAVWMTTAMVFPWLRRVAGAVVDRVVLRRPDYGVALSGMEADVLAAETEAQVLTCLASAVAAALGATTRALVVDPPSDDRRVVVVGAELRSLADPAPAALLRVHTVEGPHHAIAIGPLSGGRRLLSGDLHWLDLVSRAGARRVDALRVAHERLERNMREQQIERLASEAELRALRAQIHPHFLFNALTTIGYLIQTTPTRALETLLRLTKVLRGVLRRTTAEFSALGDEIDFIQSYLEIEHARFEERLDVRIDVPAAARRLACPTLLLQPLVENAVRHGLTARPRGGTVSVSARVDRTALVMRVADTGVGFDPDRRDERAGVGLASVAQRLRAHYGTDATLVIDSVPDQGTTVTVTIPARVLGVSAATARRKAG